MAEFTPRVFQEILGDMIDTIIGNTPITDVNPGSVVRTMLEAAAQEDDEQYFQMLNIIRSFSLDTTTGLDLDAKGYEYGVVRKAAAKATTKVTLSDSAFTKIFTGVYSGLNGPLAGDGSINGDNSTGFPASGSIIVGRDTSNVETVTYSSITTFANYVSFNLSGAFGNDHATDETIIFSQGGDRVFSAGMVIYTPASDLNDRIDFVTDDDVTLLDGEDTLTSVEITASVTGSDSNVPIGSIETFDSPPFSTAVVTNPLRVTNGADEESDQDYRDSIKDKIQSLSKGTARSIVGEISGLVSDDDAKRVVSAQIIEPNIVPDIAKVYIDDGTGFIPSYEDIGDETVVLSATGGEQFLNIDNVPIVKAFVESTSPESYVFTGGETLIVAVGTDLETFTFQASDFADPAIATAIEVQTALNGAKYFEARLSSGGNKVRIFARRNIEDTIQITGGTANGILNFPTTSVKTIHLYKAYGENIDLLSKDGSTAILESANSETYNFNVGTENICVVVDGKIDNPMQIFFETTDFAAPAAATADEIVTIINASAAGFIAELDSTGSTVKISSCTEGVSTSKIRVLENFTKILDNAVDVTSTLNVLSGTEQIFVAQNDYLYVGISDSKFNSIYIDLSIVASHDVELGLEFWNGSTWESTGFYDTTTGFTSDGRVIFPALKDWITTTVDSTLAYWVRLERTAVTVTTPPTAQLVRVCSANAILAFSETESVGSDADYTLNRFIGQIKLQTPLTINDSIVLGTVDTRGYVISVNGQTYDISTNKILYLSVDGAADRSYTFLTGDFIDWTVATAQEIVTVLNGVNASGVPNFAGITASVYNTTKIKIETNTFNGGSIQVSTGATDANTEFGFVTTIANSYDSHLAATESVTGPFTFALDDSVTFSIDGDTANLIIVPCFYEGTVTTGGSTSTFTDISLITVFTNDSDLVGFDIRWKTVATPPPAVDEVRTISAYNSATGLVTYAAGTGTAAIGDEYQLLPTDEAEVVALWNNRRITQFNDKVSIQLSTDGTKVQVSTLTTGGDGSVDMQGGGGNSELLFSTLIVSGISAYRHWSGLAQLVQWTIDGVPTDSDNYPGIRAAGTQIEVLEPLLIKISIEVDITPEDGITQNSLVDGVKSAISAYINGLGVSDDVILSDIIVAAKDVDGVFDAQIATPSSNTAIADNSLARIDEQDISVI